MLTKKLLNAVEKLGWSIAPEDDNCIYLSQYSPEGEDFGFSVQCKNNAEFYEEVNEYYNNFDAEEHASMWYGCKDSVGGVPQSLRDLLEDADAIKEMLKELNDVCNKIRLSYKKA